jgi:cytidylate kinase
MTPPSHNPSASDKSNNFTNVPVIAIDGGAGTGKGTTRSMVAKALGFHELDSGVLYRAVGLVCKLKGISDKINCGKEAANLEISIEGERIFINNEDMTSRLRSDECGKLASEMGQIPEVRAGLRQLQLNKRRPPGLVADGRDQGIIFDTPFRFFLQADPEERARRRVLQFEKMNIHADHETILAEILRRDDADKNRSIVPLIPHPEATIIDTTHLTPNEVVSIIVEAYRKSAN